MSTQPDGGPAFPVPPEHVIHYGDTYHWGYPQPGMSLRDWFAGKALQGWLASYPATIAHPVANESQDSLALYSYAMADAMLRARAGGLAAEKGQP